MWPFLWNSSDDDFIGVGLGGIGYNCRLYENTIPNFKLEVDSKPKILKNKHFMSCNVSKCPYGYEDIERETNPFIFFNVFWNLCVLWRKIESLCFSNFIHMFTYDFIQM